ncbi:MAG: helix-turn-helix transcriptional regulator [Bacteroidales bacterium]|nr:helix-turn-helix transcriptional regulator [Bacteroidales bacterium]
MENMPKTGLRKIYDALPAREHIAPKKDFINRLAKLTKVHPQTVKGWIYGSYTPDSLRQELISKELGIPVEELFQTL